MPITVITPLGNLQLNLQANASVTDIKTAIETLTRIPPATQNLTFDGVQLQDGGSLADYGVTVDSVLTLTMAVDQQQGFYAYGYAYAYNYGQPAYAAVPFYMVYANVNGYLYVPCAQVYGYVYTDDGYYLASFGSFLAPFGYFYPAFLAENNDALDLMEINDELEDEHNEAENEQAHGVITVMLRDGEASVKYLTSLRMMWNDPIIEIKKEIESICGHEPWKQNVDVGGGSLDDDTLLSEIPELQEEPIMYLTLNSMGPSLPYWETWNYSPF